MRHEVSCALLRGQARGAGGSRRRAERAGPYRPRCLARISAAEGRRYPLRETPRLTTFRFVQVSSRFRSRFRAIFVRGSLRALLQVVTLGWCRGVQLRCLAWSVLECKGEVEFCWGGRDRRRSVLPWRFCGAQAGCCLVISVASFCGRAVCPGVDVCPIPFSPKEACAVLHAVKAAAAEEGCRKKWNHRRRLGGVILPPMVRGRVARSLTRPKSYTTAALQTPALAGPQQNTGCKTEKRRRRVFSCCR